MNVITRLGIAGASRHAIELTKELRARGFDAGLVWGSEEPGEGRMEPRQIPSLNVPDLVRPISPVRDARAFHALSQAIKRRRPQIVHTHLSKAGVLGRLAARRSGRPLLIHTYHGHLLEGYFSRLGAAFVRQTERQMARITDALVAVSEEVRDDLMAAGVGRASQWHVVPLGLELAPLLTSSLAPADARARLGLPLDGSIVGIVGRLAPVKDHGLFLAAARRIAEAELDVTFVIAGDGPLRSELEREVVTNGPSGLRFLGWIEDLEALYAALDVVVLSSRNEGTPVALIEGAAAGRAVVSTDVGGVRAVVQDEVNGLIVRRRSASELAAAITRLLRSPDRRREMGRRGRNLVGDRFSIERLGTDMASLYRSLLVRAGLERSIRG